MRQTNLFEASREVIASQAFPIVIGVTDAIHVTKRFGERGGVENLTLCLDDIEKHIKSYPSVMTLLSALHIIIEESRQKVVIKVFDGSVYILQYAGFENYIEAFDYITYFNQEIYKRNVKLAKGNIVVSISENGEIKIDKSFEPSKGLNYVNWEKTEIEF